MLTGIYIFLWPELIFFLVFSCLVNHIYIVFIFFIMIINKTMGSGAVMTHYY